MKTFRSSFLSIPTGTVSTASAPAGESLHFNPFVGEGYESKPRLLYLIPNPSSKRNSMKNEVFSVLIQKIFRREMSLDFCESCTPKLSAYLEITSDGLLGRSRV